MQQIQSRSQLIRTVNVALLVAILVAINLVASNAFFKIDLTGSNAYSLSQVSRETLARVEDPIRVKVYYTESVPAPYNGVRRYLTDLLREYDAAEREYFSYEIVDVTTDEGRQEAQRYGLQQIEIQEIRSDEFQSRAVFMGAVVLYGDVVERIDRIQTTSGLEYRVTTAMDAAITQVDALSGSSESVVMDVLASSSLEELQIQGFAELEAQMAAIHERVNRDNYDRIEYTFRRPDSIGEIRDLSEEYGVRPIRWDSADGTTKEGLLEIVLHQGDRVERIPFEIFSQLFGGYTLDDPANIEEAVRTGLRSLVAANPQIGYALGHGEKALQDFQYGAGPFATLAGERFEVIPVRLAEEPIPAGIDTLVINGPTEGYDESALFRIDQFLMDGGSLFVMLDSHVQLIPSRQQQMQGAQPSWELNDTGLEELLLHYGVEITDQFVLDEESYVARQAQGSTQLFQAPIISGEGINADHSITSGLQDVIVLNAAEILLRSDDTIETTTLLRTSPQSWTVENPQEIGPWLQGAPPGSDTGRRDVAVLLEGEFESYYDEPVQLEIQVAESEESSSDAPESGVAPNALPEGSLPQMEIETDRFVERSITPGRLLVLSTSAPTTAQMLDPQSPTPNSTFLLNVLDYLNGVPGIAELRSKGLGVPRITVTNPASVVVARWGNVVLGPVIVIAIGIVVWGRRRRRSRRIQAIFQGTDGDES